MKQIKMYFSHLQTPAYDEDGSMNLLAFPIDVTTTITWEIESGYSCSFLFRKKGATQMNPSDKVTIESYCQT